jgi:hypothetical protein
MSPGGSVDFNAIALPPELRGIQQALELATPYLEALYPTYMPEELLPDHPAAAACQRVAMTMGLGAVRVALVDDQAGAAAGPGDPIPVVVSRALGGDSGGAAFRFWIGRALCAAATSSTLLGRLTDGDLEELLEALCTSRPVGRGAQQVKKQLSKVLPRKLRKQLETIVLDLSPQVLARYRAAEEERADRVGMLVSRNPGAGIEELARVEGVALERITSSSRLTGLMRYVMGEAYARAARSLWI